MHRILIADQLDPTGIEILRASGAEIREIQKDERSRLAEILPDYDALVVRSATKVTAELLKAGKRLKVVGRAGIGVDNVDVAAATELGILVVNAPTANLMSATEHTFALLLALARRVPEADASVKAGEWNRKLVGVELEHKTLGVVGFGRIGQRVAERARGFGMKVVAYDPFLDAAGARKLEVELLPLDELLRRSDVVTLHTPSTRETRGMINRERLALMKKDALLVNCARGGIVDEEALLEALDAGALGGAALDVFAEEPPTDLRLARHPNVVATPHLGAQTREAQERISIETAQMLLDALAGSLSIAAVNLPFRAAGGRIEPFLALGERLGRLAGLLLGSAPHKLQVEAWGIEEGLQVGVSVAALKGVLTPFLGEAINYVNAERIAQGRGIEIVRSTHSASGDYPHMLSVTLTGGGDRGDGGDRSVEIVGTLFHETEPRVVRINGYQLEFRPEGKLLVLENQDMPGVVGRVGTLLADAKINIADIHLARRRPGSGADAGTQVAMAVLRIDQDADDALLGRIAALAEMRSAQRVDLGVG